MSWLAPVLGVLESSKYILLFIGCYIEGSAVMMTAGLLWHLGVVDFWPAYAALIAADTLSDIMWYTIGYHGARRFFARWGHWFGITPESIAKVERRFHHYHLRILLISKLTMGFGLAVPVLTVAGMLRVPFGRYLAINVAGGIVWIACLMIIGYYFGNVLAHIPRDFQIALAVAVPLAFALILKQVAKRLETVDW